jgi:hypothetical protein
VAVADYREVDAAVVDASGDHLTVDRWEPRSGEQTPPERLLDPTVAALRSFVG